MDWHAARLLLGPRFCFDLKIIARCNLRYGHTRSCGCLGKNPDASTYLIKDITGQRFVRLIALEGAPSQRAAEPSGDVAMIAARR